MQHRFSRFTLRTTDVERSRGFYAAVLGAAFWGPDVVAVPLPAAAAARGAPPHWLGHVSVDDVAEVVARGLDHGVGTNQASS
jgi:catechol 2,3-dioxygenase-like lactoylglutathione lyase family enzyme